MTGMDLDQRKQFVLFKILQIYRTGEQGSKFFCGWVRLKACVSAEDERAGRLPLTTSFFMYKEQIFWLWSLFWLHRTQIYVCIVIVLSWFFPCWLWELLNFCTIYTFFEYPKCKQLNFVCEVLVQRNEHEVPRQGRTGTVAGRIGRTATPCTRLHHDRSRKERGTFGENPKRVVPHSYSSAFEWTYVIAMISCHRSHWSASVVFDFMLHYIDCRMIRRGNEVSTRDWRKIVSAPTFGY